MNVNWETLGAIGIALIALFKDQLFPGWMSMRKAQSAYRTRDLEIQGDIATEQSKLNRNLEDHLIQLLTRNTDVLTQLNLMIPNMTNHMNIIMTQISQTLVQMQSQMDDMQMDLARLYAARYEDQPSQERRRSRKTVAQTAEVSEIQTITTTGTK